MLEILWKDLMVVNKELSICHPIKRNLFPCSVTCTHEQNYISQQWLHNAVANKVGSIRGANNQIPAGLIEDPV